MLELQQASSAFKAKPFYKVLVYGGSGTGKTSWAFSAPRPLGLVSEPQAEPSIHQANPDAYYFHIKTIAQATQLCKRLVKAPIGEVDGQPCVDLVIDGFGTIQVQTLVVDGLTDLHDRCSDHNRTADDTPLWGKIQREMNDFLKLLRQLPMNVVCTALTIEKITDTGVSRIVPALFGQMSTKAGQRFNAVGFCEKVSAGGGVQYVTWFERGSTYETKPAPGWPSKVVHGTEKGMTSLGSLALHACADLNPPAMPWDDPQYVEQSNEILETQGQTRKRR